MSNTFNSETKDFNFVVNKALLEVTPIRLRGKIAENLLGYYNELRQEINKLKRDLDMFESVNKYINEHGYEELEKYILTSKRKSNQEKVDLLEEYRQRVLNHRELIEDEYHNCESVITTYDVMETINQMVIEILNKN